jgi:hypothetical protein
MELRSLRLGQRCGMYKNADIILKYLKTNSPRCIMLHLVIMHTFVYERLQSLILSRSINITKTEICGQRIQTIQLISLTHAAPRMFLQPTYILTVCTGSQSVCKEVG